MEVLWKIITGILNQHLTTAIGFHDTLYGFWAGRGMGAVSFKARLLQQLMMMMEAVLFEIYLDIQKLYDALDRGRCLDILTGYGVVPLAIHLLWTYWGRLIMVA